VQASLTLEGDGIMVDSVTANCAELVVAHKR
jgi:hypothetical protein